MRRVYRGFRDRSLSVWFAWALGGGKLPDRTKLKERTFMKRASASLIALASLVALIALGGPGIFASLPAMVLFSLTLSVAALGAIVEGFLARRAGRRPIISSAARRALVFVGLGPVFCALITWSVVAVISGGHADLYGIPIVYLFSLIVCAITAPVDGLLSYVTPIELRVPLTAMVGAAVSVGVIFFLVAQLGNKGPLPLESLMMPLIVGAVATGMSSLLSHNCRTAEP